MSQSKIGSFSNIPFSSELTFIVEKSKYHIGCSKIISLTRMGGGAATGTGPDSAGGRRGGGGWGGKIPGPGALRGPWPRILNIFF